MTSHVVSCNERAVFCGCLKATHARWWLFGFLESYWLCTYCGRFQLHCHPKISNAFNTAQDGYFGEYGWIWKEQVGCDCITVIKHEVPVFCDMNAWACIDYDQKLACGQINRPSPMIAHPYINFQPMLKY